MSLGHISTHHSTQLTDPSPVPFSEQQDNQGSHNKSAVTRELKTLSAGNICSQRPVVCG